MILNAQQADELARELRNPTAALASMNNCLEFRTFSGDLPGADDQNSWNYQFQPVIPFPQDNGYNLIFRPAIPLLFNEPVFSGINGQFDSPGGNLGDIGFDIAYGRTTTQSGILVLGGMVGTLPTATDDTLGNDQLALGPEFAIGITRKWGVLGALVTHSWDVVGNDDLDTSITSVEYFYAFGLGNGWQFASGPTISYDHEAASGNRLNLPIGVGVSKTTVAGKTPLDFSIQVFKNVVRPDQFSPDWTVTFTFAPVIKLPWG